jgi:predicted nucleic acid-binding protein
MRNSLASALEVGCNLIYSEDLQDGQQIDDQLMIINPFHS